MIGSNLEAVLLTGSTSKSTRAFDPSVLASTTSGLERLPRALSHALAACELRPSSPLRAGSAQDILQGAREALGGDELPVEGIGEEAALERLASILLRDGLDLSHPFAAAHLQPPSLTVAVAADALASVSNASLDTFDSGPTAIAIERWVIEQVAKLARLGSTADGVLTPGGSISNLLGLLLARDAAARRRGLDARLQGIAALGEPIVFCSEVAHFSAHRACATLGLGESAIRHVPVDAQKRMRPEAVAAMLQNLGSNACPIAIIATAGTTDFGSVDPLRELSAIARAHGVWLHVDAAYGFGALFSEQLAARLDGIEHADSITLDLHKLGWQPAAASVLLVADAEAFRCLDRQVAYLNPADDADAGLSGLLGRSVQTTRRPDAAKVAATLLAHGRRGLGKMVDACHDRARYAEARIVAEPSLELVAPAELTTVVFRYRLGGSRAAFPEEGKPRAVTEDALNGALRRHLLETGVALIGRTSVANESDAGTERVCLKLTLLNPTASLADIDALLDAVLRAGRECERRLGAQLDEAARIVEQPEPSKTQASEGLL